MHEDLRLAEPSTYEEHCLAQERKRRTGRIQTPEPSAHGGGIGHAIGIFDRRRRSFPGTAFQEVTPQRLTAGDEAVVTVWGRKGRQERERLAAAIATAAPNRDPIMVFIMSLSAAATMTDDGILQTNRAMAQDEFRTHFGPIPFEVVLRGRKRDKQNRTNVGVAQPATLPRSATGVAPLASPKNPNWKRITLRDGAKHGWA